MKFRGVPRGGAVDFYMAGLLVGGVAFWLLAGYSRAPVALFQLFSVSFVGAAVYLMVRYRLTVFEIALEVRSGSDAASVRDALPGEIDFVASRIKGKRTVPLARLSLSELRRAEGMSSEEVKAAVVGASLYRYNTNMSPKEGLFLLFDGDGERDIALFVDMIPSEMMAVINSAVRQNKTKFTPDGEI